MLPTARRAAHGRRAAHAQELSRRLRRAGSPVTANALHPGFVATAIGRPSREQQQGGGGGGGRGVADLLADAFWALAAPLTKTLGQGAATTLHVALAPGLRSVSGAYFDDCRAVAPAAHTLGAAGEAAAARLWARSERLVAAQLAPPKPTTPPTPTPKTPKAPVAEEGAALPPSVVPV